MRPWEKLHARWREHGYDGGLISEATHVPLVECGGAFPTEGMIEAIEQRYGLALPVAFREHLLHLPLVGGDGLDGGGELLVFWTAERVGTVAELKYHFDLPGRPETYLVFCDYLISCWDWAIECSPGDNYGKIARLGDDKFVFNSFEELVEVYIASTDDVAFACHDGLENA